MTFIHKTKIVGDLLHPNLAMLKALLNQLETAPSNALTKWKTHLLFEKRTHVVQNSI